MKKNVNTVLTGQRLKVTLQQNRKHSSTRRKRKSMKTVAQEAPDANDVIAKRFHDIYKEFGDLASFYDQLRKEQQSQEKSDGSDDTNFRINLQQLARSADSEDSGDK